MQDACGFVADPEKPKNHNLAIRLLNAPSTALSSRPSNLSCHNLCAFKTPPKKHSALLGLGLNFCLTPRQTALKNFRMLANASSVMFTQKCFLLMRTMNPGILNSCSSVPNGNQTRSKSLANFKPESPTFSVKKRLAIQKDKEVRCSQDEHCVEQANPITQ
jgi:hypothetical protein